MDTVEKIISELKKSGINETIDIRVTYSAKGVKVHIAYCAYSDKQTKPFPSFNEAIWHALNSYKQCCIYKAKVENHFATYCGQTTPYESYENIEPIRLEYYKNAAEQYKKLLPHIDACVDILCICSIK